ncbi:hypothetical protein ACR42D_09975 [Desulfovibrio caledoniensis]
MQPDTQICNLALSLLKITDPIANVLTESSTEALQCRMHWTPVLKEVLRAYPWRFALKRWNLGGPSDTDDPVFGWGYAYKLPQDCLRVVGVFGADGTELREAGSWEKEGGCILTDEPGPVYITGVQLVEDAKRFDPLFVNALSYRLAAQIAPGVGEGGMQDNMLAFYTSTLRSGRAIDADEAAPPVRDVSGWVAGFRG